MTPESLIQTHCQNVSGGWRKGPAALSGSRLAGFCFDGRREINGDLMAVGRARCNNMVLATLRG